MYVVLGLDQKMIVEIRGMKYIIYYIRSVIFEVGDKNLECN